MISPRRAATVLLVVLLLLVGAPQAAAAIGTTVYGNGLVRGNAGGASFSVALDDSHPLAFDYVDLGSDPPHTFIMSDNVQVDCLGQLFGGQTLQLTGPGSDSAAPNEATIVQVFLVDGGGSGPDRISIKARRANGRVVYFLPLRDLDSGDLSISCSG